MGVRTKIFGLIGLVFLATTAITWVATVSLVQSQYIKLEAEEIQRDAAQATDAVDGRVTDLARKLPDWSSWDDTYLFMKDRNQAYRTSNLQNSVLQSMGINFILYLDVDRRLVTATAADIDSGDTIPVPDELRNAIRSGAPPFSAGGSAPVSGIIRTGTYPLIVASRPILRTDGTGPARGTLVFAEYLSPSIIASLNKTVHLEAEYTWALDAAGNRLPDAVATGTDVARTKTNGADTISAFQIINDVYGQPLLVAKVTEPREIYQETRRTLAFYLLVVFGVTLGAIVVSMYTTNRIIRQDRTIKLKNEFFSIASHELRTPLAAILGNSALIESVYGPKNDEKLVELTRDIHEPAARLVKIVTNFLDAARLESGKMPLELTSVTLDGPVGAVVAELQAVADTKHLYVKSQLPPSLPPARADSERVQQVIYNLVGNAMKFTDTGGITISAEQVGAMIEVRVADTGRGIPPAAQQKLFKSFQQTKSSDANEGSGLGLHISKLLVEAMGGRIKIVSSEEGKGTTLAFTLPVAGD